MALYDGDGNKMKLADILMVFLCMEVAALLSVAIGGSVAIISAAASTDDTKTKEEISGIIEKGLQANYGSTMSANPEIKFSWRWDEDKSIIFVCGRYETATGTKFFGASITKFNDGWLFVDVVDDPKSYYSKIHR